jgi:hypothetical protein
LEEVASLTEEEEEGEGEIEERDGWGMGFGGEYSSDRTENLEEILTFE